MSPRKAAERLDALAQEAEDENYHTLAGNLWSVALSIKEVTSLTYVLVVSELGIESLTVTP